MLVVCWVDSVFGVCWLFGCLGLIFSVSFRYFFGVLFVIGYCMGLFVRRVISRNNAKN